MPNSSTHASAPLMAEAAGFVANANLDQVAPGAVFQATWTFRNNGRTPWQPDYRFVYTLTSHSETSGFPTSPLGSPTTQTFSQLGVQEPVAPGETVSLTLSLTAPHAAGTHASNWQLQTPAGERFGPIRWMRVVVDPATAVPVDSNHLLQVVEFKNSVENFNNMQPGRQFTGTWTLRNVGTSTWSGKFRIKHLKDSIPATANYISKRLKGPKSATLQELGGKSQVAPGETVTIPLDLIAPSRAGGYAYHWQMEDENGKPFGGIRWLVINVVAAGAPEPTPDPIVPSDAQAQFGMNVNINPGGHPLDVERLDGLGWVRFVFWASRENQSPEAIYQQRYRHIIQSYANRGIRSLIILHQDTYWGNGPWQNGGWEQYARNFGRECGRVAAVCAEFGDMVAYQVYNEQDSGYGNDAGNPNHSAIGIEPQNYALILKHAAAGIRSAHPTARIIFGGCKTGPQNSINYIRDVERALGGPLPVHALAYHPYGRYVKTPIFNFGSIGTLADSLNLFKNAYPQFPLWITEVGAAADTPITAEHYSAIATYMREVVDEVADNFADNVPVLIWFGWTDLMRNAGVNTLDNKPKAHVFDAFKKMKARGRVVEEQEEDFIDAAGSEFVSSTSTLSNLNAVPAGSTFTSRWTFRNSGSTTWDNSYKLVYTPKGANPTPMLDKESFSFVEVCDRAPVRPGETTTFSLTMTAPETSGRTFRSQWQLVDDFGQPFGFLYEEITVVPAPTAGTGVRAAGMTFLADHTVPDHTRFVAGTDFNKQWLVKNSGDRHWGNGFRLVFVEGDLQLSRGVTTHMVPKAALGETVTLTISMTAPPARGGRPTTYQSMWRMQDDRGNWFGDPLWVVISATTAVSSDTGTTALGRLLNDPTIWYSQLNSAWANDRLGTGQATIGTWGCLMSCMAMALSAYGTRINPKEMNQRLVSISSDAIIGSNVQFVAPWYIGGLRFNNNVKSWPNEDIAWAVWTGEDPIRRIDNALAEGKIVIAQVDTKPNNGFYNNNNEQHWVVIVKRTPDGADYLMIDPLTPPEQVYTQPRHLMQKYGNPKPGSSHETNLRHAIKSTLVYHKSGGSGS